MVKEFGPDIIAQSFIKQYYELLATEPHLLFRFYKEDSSFTHAEGHNVTEAIVGAEKIRERVEELNLAGARFDLSEGSLDAHRSENGGVLVLATGVCAVPGHLPRNFVQTFFLASQASATSYYVRSSILRLLGLVSSAATATTGSSAVRHAHHVDTSTNTAATATASAGSMTDSVAPTTGPSTKSPGKGRGNKKQEAAPAASAAPAPAPESPSIAENPIVDAVVVMIEDISNELMRPHAPAETVQLVEMLEEAEQALAAVEIADAIAHSVAAAAANSAPKSFADLFRASSSAAPAAVAEAPKKQQRQPKAERTATTAAPAAATAGGKAPRERAPKANPAPEASAAPAASATATPGSIFVKGLPEGASVADIRRVFEGIGAIKGVEKNATSDFGFVEFADAASVAEVLSRFTKDANVFVLSGKALKVQERTSKKDNSGPRSSSSAPASGNKSSGGEGCRRGPRGGDASAPQQQKSSSQQQQAQGGADGAKDRRPRGDKKPSSGSKPAAATSK